MHLKFFPIALLFAASTGFCASVDFVGSSFPLTVDHATEIPGNTLKAGSYSISVTEQLADRMIVRIDSTTSTNHAIFLGVPSAADKMGGSPGAVTWPAGVNKTPTLRGIIFPNGNAVEFVYPKAEAAALAKDNSASVVAVDPRSEGRVALKNLSQDELQIVNLWLLSLTTTGPDNKTPAVLARRYDGSKGSQQPVVATSAAPAYPAERTPVAAPAVVARNTPIAPPIPLQRPVATQRAFAGKRDTAVRPVRGTQPQVASLEEPVVPPAVSRRGPVLAQLPHTASLLPLVWMVGLLSLAGAALVRVRRTSRGLSR
jgi:hypothetical protein